MPRFLNETHPDINSFRRVNKEIVKRRRKKYSTFQTPVMPTGAIEPVAPKYEEFKQKLVALNASMTDLRETVRLSATSTTPSTVIDRFVSTTTNIGGQVTNLTDYFTRQLNRNLNSFSDSEIQEIKVLNYKIQELLFESIVELQERIADRRGRNWRARELFNTRSLNLITNFAQPLGDLLGMINDAIRSYKQSGIGAGRSRRCGAELYSQEPVLKGGEALRTGMNFSNPFTRLGPYPPRNTQDLQQLPRRFL